NNSNRQPGMRKLQCGDSNLGRLSGVSSELFDQNGKILEHLNSWFSPTSLQLGFEPDTTGRAML
ncbi:hypothetical protein L9F63_003576, partial [Diploptera punctata]